MTLPYSVEKCAQEVFEYCELTPAQINAAFAELERAWKNTSGRFYAYNSAHVIAANIKRNAP
jgi:hypothetical protein